MLYFYVGFLSAPCYVGAYGTFFGTAAFPSDLFYGARQSRVFKGPADAGIACDAPHMTRTPDLKERLGSRSLQ